MGFWDKFHKRSTDLNEGSEETVEGMVGNELPPFKGDKLFDIGKQYPPVNEIERIAKYKRGKKIFDGKTYQVSEYNDNIFRNSIRYQDKTHLYEVYNRAEKLLADNEFVSDQLQHLYIAVNLVDILIVKPADLMVGESPKYDATTGDETEAQKALDRIVEENDLNTLIHETVVGAGYRGDSWLKVRYSYRQDFSELPPGVEIPSNVKPEPIIEAVNPLFIFPELSRGSVKNFKAINHAYIEWVEEKRTEVPYLNVERHVPGAIMYERYRVRPDGMDTKYGVTVEQFYIEERVPTGRNQDIVETGVAHPLLIHVPYRTADDTWEGQGMVEKIESVLAAINDRIAQIDYILWKHADPSISGPQLEDEKVKFGGKYFEIDKDDIRPEYMVWDAQLASAFQELEMLIGLVFQMSETPQFIFGTTLAGNGNSAGGTSHTTGDAVKARYFPLTSKVKRIRMHVDKAIRQALWTAQLLENYANNEIDDFSPYEAQYPTIIWKDGLPRDEKTLAEVMQIRTGGKATIDVVNAIKYLDQVGEVGAKEIYQRIKDNETVTETTEPTTPNLQPTENKQGEVNP